MGVIFIILSVLFVLLSFIQDYITHQTAYFILSMGFLNAGILCFILNAIKELKNTVKDNK